MEILSLSGVRAVTEASERLDPVQARLAATFVARRCRSSGLSWNAPTPPTVIVDEAITRAIKATFLYFVCVDIARLGSSKPAIRFSSVQRDPRIPSE